MAKALASWQLPAAVVLALVACSFTSCHAEFDYFLFARQWPATFCNIRECQRRPENVSEFTIHGLWPQNYEGPYPHDCNPEYQFDQSQIQDLLSEMEDDWPSLILSDFWEHEWEKHGTCSLDVFPTEHDYFAATLKLHKAYDLEDALAADGIVPSDEVKYQLTDIKNAFQEHLGNVPFLKCTRGELNEVRMCVTKELEPFDCPMKSQCPRRVKLPPFPGELVSSAKNATPCNKAMHHVRNLVQGARACPYTVGAIVLGLLAIISAAVLLIVHRRAAAERRDAVCSYTRIPGSDSKLPL